MRSRKSRYKAGEWLVVDEESGFTRYASEVEQDWKGSYIRKNFIDKINPSVARQVPDDDTSVSFITARTVMERPDLTTPVTVGNTSVKTKISPADFMFNGIGEEEIGSFTVR